MYKVFFNQRILLITDKYFPLKNGEHIVVEPDKMELEKWLSIFLTNLSLVKLVVVASNTDRLFELLKELFNYLEAAGGLVKNEMGDLLFIYRLNRWDLPKGKREKGETIVETALREVAEECGLNGVEIKGNSIKSYHIYPLNNHYVLKATYWFEMDYKGDEILIPQSIENITKAQWLHPSDFSMVVANTYPSVLDVLTGFGYI